MRLLPPLAGVLGSMPTEHTMAAASHALLEAYIGRLELQLGELVVVEEALSDDPRDAFAALATAWSWRQPRKR